MATTLLTLLQAYAVDLLSLASSIAALAVALTISRREQLNDNSWEIYRNYNETDIRTGRKITQQILRDTKQKGFPDRKAFEEYFGATAALAPTPERAENRQSFFDLAAFYHQTGLLLARGRLDRGFTLALVGQGLKDRWKVYQAIATFYPERFSYGGIYYLYREYLKWEKSRFARLQPRLRKAYQDVQGK